MRRASVIRSRGPTARPPTPATASLPVGVQRAAEWSWRLSLIALGVAIAVFLLVQIKLVVIAVIIAVLLAALLVPFTDFLRARGAPEWLAVTMGSLALMVVGVGLLILGAGKLARGLGDLGERAATLLADLQDWLMTGPLGLGRRSWSPR